MATLAGLALVHLLATGVMQSGAAPSPWPSHVARGIMARARARFPGGRRHEIANMPSCADYAKGVIEPFTGEYAMYREKVEVEEGGGRDGGGTFFRWEGEIEKDDVERLESCWYCGGTAAFKVVEGRLYVRRSGRGWGELWEKPELEVRYQAAVEMLLMTLHLFAIPNVDFIVNLEDRNYCGMPALTYGPNPGCQKAGFAMPSWSTYINSRGPQQLEAMFECLQTKYPRKGRARRAVWRGSTTGFSSLNTSNYMMNTRVRLAFLGRFNTHLMDAGLSSYVQLNRSDEHVVEVLERDVPLVPRIEMDDFNDFEVIIDLDGNAWSDRFSQLVVFNTPLFKQDSTTSKEYYGHLMRNGTHVVYFKEDLSDFLPRLSTLLARCHTDPRYCNRLVTNMQQFAREHLSHLGVMRATAHALVEVAKRISWTPELDDAYTEIPKNTCCSMNPTFPQELVDRVSPTEMVDSAVAEHL
ncbi:unnamed protein product [Ostreobium quekettii]|uniref:Glycosyl transferase CAP10 domain-containing protein n=1 Tax=Ostreobium quekettii TaxID=121088 RepID=A0A8S1IPA1_9CHLO|nr:unnamed protein product [Ostreobium quekettii]|eukprot:evm.model.scf_124.3 EVM.evm.TU.scf_124.3   scf_124:58525-61802(+)